MEFGMKKHPSQEIVYVEIIPKNNNDHALLDLFNGMDLEDPRIKKLFDDVKKASEIPEHRILSMDYTYDRIHYFTVRYHNK